MQRSRKEKGTGPCTSGKKKSQKYRGRGGSEASCRRFRSLSGALCFSFGGRREKIWGRKGLFATRIFRKKEPKGEKDTRKRTERGPPSSSKKIKKKKEKGGRIQIYLFYRKGEEKKGIEKKTVASLSALLNIGGREGTRFTPLAEEKEKKKN